MVKQFETYIRRLLWQQFKKPEGKATRAFSRLQGFTSANYMMLNFKGGFANVSVGAMGIISEAAAHEYFNKAELTSAIGEYSKGIFSYTRGMYNTNSYSLQDAIIKALKVVDYDEITGVCTKVGLKKWSERIRNLGFAQQSGGEHMMQNTVLFAMLKSNKLVVMPDDPYGVGVTPMSEADYITYKESDILKDIRGSKEVYTALNKGVNYFYVTPQREKMARTNISVEEFSKFMKSSLEGLFIDYIPQGFARTPVLIRQSSDIAYDVSKFQGLELSSEDDLVVPINSVAEIKAVDGPISIMREQSSRVGVVRSNVEDRDLGGFVEEAMARISAEVKLPDGYTLTYGGQFENQQRANARFSTVIPLSILVIFFILFFTFRSITLSLMILLNIPFAVTGGLISLYLSGEYMSVPASVGFIALFGIAVLNGLVMVGYFVQLIKKGYSIDEAVEMGAKRRLRPVLMTASIAALGLVPMLIGGGVGSEVQKPLAVVVLGGLATSTALTLLILPPTFKMIAKRFKIISEG